ncbi:hypothetical protein Lal_00039317 [Lupinus albus]|nr:hypothetical protein Lal_00039317 [Lupinus albus]
MPFLAQARILQYSPGFHPPMGNTGHLHPINPEIDRTYHRLVRHSINLPFHSVLDSVSVFDSISDSIPVSVHSVQYTDFVHSVALSDSEHSENSVHSENMAQPPTPPGPRERTLMELATPDLTYDSLCIQYPNEDVPYVLKTGLIHLLPKFNGLAGEDPHKHLKEFHIVCSTMKSHDVQEDHIRFGGALGDMTPFEARGLIENMASNSQQFNARSSDSIIVRGVHDVGTDSVR